MDDDVHVVIMFDVVQTNVTLKVGLVCEVIGRLRQVCTAVYCLDGLGGELGCENEGNIVQRWIGDVIAIRENVDLTQWLGESIKCC